MSATRSRWVRYGDSVRQEPGGISVYVSGSTQAECEIVAQGIANLLSESPTEYEYKTTRASAGWTQSAPNPEKPRGLGWRLIQTVAVPAFGDTAPHIFWFWERAVRPEDKDSAR